MKLSKFRRSALALLAAAQLAACTSTGKKAADDDLEASLSSDAAVQVVTQVGQKDAIVSRRDRQYWLGLRSNAKGPLAKARGALATGEAEAAADLARAHLAKNPGNSEALVVLSAALAMSRKYELASYYAGLVDKAEPGHPVAMNIKGLAAMLSPKSRATDFRRAADYFKAAFDANDAQIAPGLNLAHLQLELGDAASALATFSEVERRCGGCTPALLGVGVAANRVGKYDQAVDALNDVLAKKPNHSGALYYLALVYKNGYNDKKQAEKHLYQLLADESSGDAYMKERAQTVLRELKGQADAAERTALADDSDAAGASEAGDDRSDAELMMSSAEMDGEE